MADFGVRGAAQVERAAKSLKTQGEAGKGLRKEMLRTIQTTTKPLREGLKASARSTLPKRGGLAATVAGSGISTRTRTTGSKVGVRIVATGGKKVRDIQATDRGLLRHPVFGRWVKGLPPQQITPGWWSKPLAAFAPKVRKELLAAMERVNRDIARGSR